MICDNCGKEIIVHRAQSFKMVTTFTTNDDFQLERTEQSFCPRCTAAEEVTAKPILDKLHDAIQLARVNTFDEPEAIRFTEGPAPGQPMVKVRQIVEVWVHPDDWPEIEKLGEREGYKPTMLFGISVVPPA